MQVSRYAKFELLKLFLFWWEVEVFINVTFSRVCKTMPCQVFSSLLLGSWNKDCTLRSILRKLCIFFSLKWQHNLKLIINLYMRRRLYPPALPWHYPTSSVAEGVPCFASNTNHVLAVIKRVCMHTHEWAYVFSFFCALKVGSALGFL